MTLDAEERPAMTPKSDLALVTSSSAPPHGNDGPLWCLAVRTVEIADDKEDNYVGHAVQGLLLIMDPTTGEFKRIGFSTSSVCRKEWLLAGEK